MRRIIAIIFLLSFILSSIFPVPGYAQGLFPEGVMPLPGKMVEVSAPFTPAIFKGMKVYPKEPLRFDFLLDTGNTALAPDGLEKEAARLVRYFLAALTVPEKDLWVNLSPYEGDRIIPEQFGLTEMGRDLLGQDYILKQLTSSLMYPEKAIGARIWKKIYALAAAKFGTTDIPMDTFNKVWIIPDEATVYVNGNIAYIAKTHLKVMLDTDYLAAQRNTAPATSDAASIPQQVIRAIVLPELEKEINNGANFITLRQIYHAMVLATWFKRNLKKSFVGQVYAEKNKVTGIDLADKHAKDKIWSQYVAAFKKGVFNYIKEEMDETTQEVLPRKYFSGGIVDNATAVNEVLVSDDTMMLVAGAENLQTVLTTMAIEYAENEYIKFNLPDVRAPEIILIAAGPEAIVQKLRGLAAIRKELIPQIIVEMTHSLYRSELTKEIAAYFDDLTSVSSEHDLLIIYALSEMALKNNADAKLILHNVFSKGPLSGTVVDHLIQASKMDDKRALYALGIFMVSNGRQIYHRIGDSLRLDVLQLLNKKALASSTTDEIEAMNAMILHSEENDEIEKLGIQFLEGMADIGKEEAMYYFVRDASIYSRFSRKAKFIEGAEGVILKIEQDFERSIVENPVKEEKIEMMEYFRRRLAVLVYGMATDTDDKGLPLSERLSQYGHWQKFDVFRPLLWKPKIRSHIFENRRKNELDEPLEGAKGRAIVVYPKSDYNIAFMYSTTISQLIEAGYSVLYYEVASPEEMLAAFEDATNNARNPATYVEIAGHGTPYSIQFGNNQDKNSNLYSYSEILLPGSLRRYFTADAIGILSSCSTGSWNLRVDEFESIDQAKMLAEALAKDAEGGILPGPSLEVTVDHLNKSESFFAAFTKLKQKDKMSDVQLGAMDDVINTFSIQSRQAFEKELWAELVNTVDGQRFNRALVKVLYSFVTLKNQKRVNMVTAMAAALGIVFSGPSHSTSAAIKIDFLFGMHDFPHATTVTISPVQQSFNKDSSEVGGIDLNADKLRLQETGGMIDFSGEVDAAALEI